jgi:oligosaccharide reducing-end xylanase
LEQSATPTLPPPPAAPTGLTATAGNTQASLSWTASSGATSYNVKSATVSGGPYTTIANVTATSFVNTGLPNGTTYYYVVSALNTSGEGTNSSQASATPTAVPVSYNIGTWRGFRTAAVSYTFDDDCPNQYAEAVPMFHAAGLKITLFTVTSWLGSWSQVQQAAAWGDEIASHTVTHPDLTTLSSTQLTTELANSQSTINSNVTNESCLTLAYPNCTVPSESATAQYYFAARVCSGQLVPSTPSDFLQISSYILGNTGSYTTGASINALADNAYTAGKWCVYLTHAIDGDSGYSPLASSALQASVTYMTNNPNKFWVETFGNVVRYIKERNASSVTEISSTGSTVTVQVTNSLNNSIYNYPITIRRPLPAGWIGVTDSQNNQPIPATVVAVNSVSYLMFDAVPNGGNVVLSNTLPSPPALSNPVLTPPDSLTIGLSGQSNVNYAIYGSTDLVNWLPIQSNLMVGTYTNFTTTTSNSLEFYRAQSVP